MSVTNTGQWVGMFNLHHLGVKLSGGSVLQSSIHFAFFGVFSYMHLIKNICGELCDPLLFPVWVGCCLLTRPSGVVKNLKDWETDPNKSHAVSSLSYNTVAITTPNLYIDSLYVL